MRKHQLFIFSSIRSKWAEFFNFNNSFCDFEFEQITKKNGEIEHMRQKIGQLKSQINKNPTNSTSSSTPCSITTFDTDTIKSYQKVKELGRGDNGTVYEVIKKKLYVLKELNRLNVESFKNLIKEYEILNILHHPNVIKTYGIYLSDETTPPSIILEHCSQNIENAIKTKSFSKSQIVFSIYQIAEGMKYVHFRNVIHRDIKPSNIVVAEDGTIKICDFGVSKMIDPSLGYLSNSTGIGTLFFMAPEIINEEKSYNEKVDVYSFGVLAYFILSNGQMPNIKIRDIVNGKMAPIPPEFTQLAKDLIEKCWNFDPSKRPSFDEICTHLEEKNNKLIDLDDANMKDALDLINQHKIRIPFYSH